MRVVARTRKPRGPGARTAETWTPSQLVAILDEEYGRPDAQPHGDAATELALTLLSQNTSDHNSGRAFQRLLERFPSWDDVIAAPTGEVEDAIRPGGLAPTKAPRLQQLLAEVRERAHGYELDFLADLPLDEAKAWLRALPGVGPKTAACVLLFALGRPALPVDTHVERVAKRLDLVPAKMPAAQAHDALEAMLQPRRGLRLPRRPDPARPPHLPRALARLRGLRAVGALPSRRAAATRRRVAPQGASRL